LISWSGIRPSGNRPGKLAGKRQELAAGVLQAGPDTAAARLARPLLNSSATQSVRSLGAMALTDEIFGIHGTALQLRSQRMGLLASNIANAATPGFKARDIDFTAALDEASRSGAGANEAAESHTLFRMPLQPSLDGNTVELSTEQTQFAENAIQYQSTLSFLNGRISTLTRALRGD
jgi:flagellar basal-body rod protein FlgB